MQKPSQLIDIQDRRFIGGKERAVDRRKFKLSRHKLYFKDPSFTMHDIVEDLPF